MSFELESLDDLPFQLVDGDGPQSQRPAFRRRNQHMFNEFYARQELSEKSSIPSPLPLRPADRSNAISSNAANLPDACDGFFKNKKPTDATSECFEHPCPPEVERILQNRARLVRHKLHTPQWKKSGAVIPCKYCPEYEFAAMSRRSQKDINHNFDPRKRPYTIPLTAEDMAEVWARFDVVEDDGRPVLLSIHDEKCPNGHIYSSTEMEPLIESIRQKLSEQTSNTKGNYGKGRESPVLPKRTWMEVFAPLKKDEEEWESEDLADAVSVDSMASSDSENMGYVVLH